MANWPYNSTAWKKLRAAHLARFPFCEGCPVGAYRLANTVDHRLAISEGGHPFPNHDGLASYCPGCHSAKTARGAEAGAIKSTKPRKGCDANGNPLDQAHPWHLQSTQNDAIEIRVPQTAALELSRNLRNKSLRADDGRPPSTPNTELVSKGCSDGR